MRRAQSPGRKAQGRGTHAQWRRNKVAATRCVLVCLLATMVASRLACSQQGQLVAKGKNAAARGSREEQMIESLRAKLARWPHPQFGAANWDVLDYPQKPGAPLKLADARRPGHVVDVRRDFAGSIVVIAEVNPKASHGAWQSGEGTPPAVEAYRRLYDEYAPKGVVFVAVWRPAARYSKPDARDLNAGDALAYADEHRLPGHILLDGPGRDARSRGAYYDYAAAAVPGHPPDSVVCIQDAGGRLVYRGIEKQVGFGYHVMKLMLDRLLDPEFDAAVRREFYPEKARELPRVEKRPEGLAYVEDFESYPDDHAFKLEPRWGFSYSTQARLDIRPVIAEGEGIGGSKAALVHNLGSINCLVYSLEHRFPAPLMDGHLRFFVRRRPAEVHELELTEGNISARLSRFSRPRRALCVRFGRPGSYEPAGFLFATGDWMKETLVADFRLDRPGPIRFSKKDWQKVEVLCLPGKKAELTVDGKHIALLESEGIASVGFRLFELQKKFYVDDVELFYRGDPEKLLALHRSARPESVRHVEPFTPEEMAELTRTHRPVPCGAHRAELPPAAMPRADVVPRGRGAIWTFDHPLEVGPLVLDDLRRPGHVLDVTKKYRGKIVWITKAHKGDHFGEGHMRTRTAHRSYTVFNRCARLAREYGPKGVVVVGVAAPEAGHRDTSTTFEDRVVTAMESVWVTRALMAEANLGPDDVIYGIFPELFDELLGERLPNHLRIWSKTMNKRLVDGQFAGFGPDIILNREGKVVFRGAGPDGQGYWMQRAALDRLLDPDFDAAFRQEFRNPDLPYYRTPALPRVEKRPDGLAYMDDMESYESSYEFRLQPRWGFAYDRVSQQELSFGGTVEKGSGRGGSQAVMMTGMAQADVLHPNRRWSRATHQFPAPLRDGHFRFFIRRGPTVQSSWGFGRPPVCRILVSAFDPEGKRLAGLTTTSPWKQERFMLIPPVEELVGRLKAEGALSRYSQGLPFELAPHWDKAGQVTNIRMAEDAWQEVRLVCRPGRKAQVLVDGKLAGELASEAISAVEIRGETFSGTWVDDVELFYAGDAERLPQEHARALADDLKARQARWREEAKKWDELVGR